MCGRFFSILTNDDLARVFGVRTGLNLQPRYNIAPTQTVLTLRADAAAALAAVPMRWGLVPGWAKAIGTTPLFNARIETAAEKPSFRTAWKARRCVVPASGWFEWMKTQGGGKQALAIRPADDAPLAFAGLWEVWQGGTTPATAGEGHWLESVTLLTEPARGAALSAVHERMPVLVAPAAVPAWIGAGTLAPVATDGLRIDPVDPAVGNVRNEGPALIVPRQP